MDAGQPGVHLQRAPLGDHQRTEHLVHESQEPGHGLRHREAGPALGRGQWRDFVLKASRSTQSTVSVLGQNGRVLEYQPQVNPQPTLKQEADGLHLHAMFTHRLQDNSRWPNPIVLKITG